MTTEKKNGFLLTYIPNNTTDNHSRIFGYQGISITTLEEAVKDLAVYVPAIKVYAIQAKKDCTKNTELTDDKSAAIYLYTMQTSFHSKLNDVLRTEDREKIKPWFAYLKLFITALHKLPSLAITVYRGVASDIQFNFKNNPVQTWWTVNSCSKDLKVIEFYLDGMGTVFAIETIHGKDIAKYSSKSDEQEVILMPGTRLALKCDPLEIKDRPFLVAFKEW